MERICIVVKYAVEVSVVGGGGAQFGNKGLVLAAPGLRTPGDYVKGHDVHPGRKHAYLSFPAPGDMFILKRRSYIL